MINDVSRAFFEAPMGREVCIELPEEDLEEEDAGKDFFGLSEALRFSSGGSLYINTPVRPGQKVLLMGGAEGIERKEPVAWTYLRKDGGKTFYTSLGHVGDFAHPAFNKMLARAVRWSATAKKKAN